VNTQRDEVSLLGLWQVVVHQKKTILTVWLATMLCAVGYLLAVTPIFKVDVFMLPPSLADIQVLNLKVLGEKYKKDAVFDLFVQTLKSRSNRKHFYTEHQLEPKLGIEENDDKNAFFEENFNERLVVDRSKKSGAEASFVTLSFTGEDADLLVKTINSFVVETQDIVAKRLVDEVSAAVAGKRAELEDVISGKLQIAKQRREDTILTLKEAVAIANELNDKDRALSGDSMRKGGLAINTSKVPLYMFSANALKAQIKVLKSRKDDAPFIPDLRDLQERLATLEQIKVDETKVSPVFVDQLAFVPNEPEKPNKPLIIALSMLLGLLLGLVVAFIRNALALKTLGEATV